MANVVNKIFTDRMGGRKATEYIGIKGDLFYDSEVGDIRISDGTTVGGKPIGGGDNTNGIYRGFQAGVNIFRQNRQNGEYDIAQIFIHDSEGRVDYINYTPNTDNDDFYVTGLVHDDNVQDQSWSANQVVALNVYSKTDGGLTAGALRTFVRKFIDTVLYTDQDERVDNAQTAKDLFYTNIEILKQSLPADALYDNFDFNDYDRYSNPEYNMIHADGTTADGNYSADFYAFINAYSEEGAYPGYDNYNNCSQIDFRSAGTGYAIGDKLTANGAQMWGSNGVNDFTLTVTALKNGNITGLTMTSGGTNMHPSNNLDSYFYLDGGSGNDAAIYITSCDSSGVIQNWNVRNGGGYNYQVGDTLTLNMGGDVATFEVTSVGTNGISGINVEGTAYLGSPRKIENGYWPKYYIADGLNDQYDTGNIISTNRSSWAAIVNVTNNNQITTVDTFHQGSVPLQRGMWCSFRDPENVTNITTFQLVSQATDNNNVWFIDGGLPPFENLQMRIDGIPYGNGQVQDNGAFGNGEGSGQYVTVYEDSIFAMMAFDLQGTVNSVYYNGSTGVDTNGTKLIETLLGSSDGTENSKLIQQRLIYDTEYTLQTADIGKHIYNPGGDNTIYIPVESVANFPVGSVVTFISSNGNPTWISRNDSNQTQVWGAGFNTQSNWWAIPAGSMGTILKVGPDKWIVSGAGLYNDD